MKHEYKKTIAVWTDIKADQDILSTIISGKGYDPFISEKEDELLSIPYFLLFAKYSREAAWFIGANKEIRKKVTDGDLKCVVLYHLADPKYFDDISRGFHFPKDTIKIDMDTVNKNEITGIIEKQANKAQKISTRKEALSVKLNRLFYIYSQLVDKGEISVTEILEKAHITRRTLSRDIKTIRDVCIDKTIENHSDFNVYVMKDLENKNEHGDH
jgi:hypothetical protein